MHQFWSIIQGTLGITGRFYANASNLLDMTQESTLNYFGVTTNMITGESYAETQITENVDQLKTILDRVEKGKQDCNGRYGYSEVIFSHLFGSFPGSSSRLSNPIIKQRHPVTDAFALK